MSAEPRISPTDEAPTGLWFVLLCPPAEQAAQIDAALADGRAPVVEVVMEVLGVCPDGRALLWICDLTGTKTPRLVAARLPADRLAEVLAARAQGLTAQIRMTFEVIGAGADGYGAITRDPHGRLEFTPAQASENLGVMLGMASV